MIGDRIRTLRERRAWTQAHLADAAGVSLRTVQRLERIHSCSHESLLALAAALDVDVRELTAEPLVSAKKLPAKTAAVWAAALMLPLVTFVVVNLLKSSLGVAAPFNLLATAGGALGVRDFFNLWSPPLFVGGGIAAIILSIAGQVQVDTQVSGGAIAVRGFRLRLDVWSTCVLLIALAALAAVGAYLLAENLTEFVQAIAR